MTTSAVKPDIKDPKRVKLQAAVDKLVTVGAADAQFRVTSGGETFIVCSGVREYGRAEPVPTDGRFRVACITKVFRLHRHPATRQGGQDRSGQADRGLPARPAAAAQADHGPQPALAGSVPAACAGSADRSATTTAMPSSTR